MVHCVLINNHVQSLNTKLTVDGNAFTPDQNTLVIPVVNSDTKYECPYKVTEVDLVISFSLNIPSIKTSLIPTFMMRKAIKVSVVFLYDN